MFTGTWLDTSVPDTTTQSPERGGKEATMAFQFPTGPMSTTAEFSAAERGLLAAGTVTSRGVIVGRSYTAYEMADGAYVPFDSIHVKASAAMPLVVLR